METLISVLIIGVIITAIGVYWLFAFYDWRWYNLAKITEEKTLAAREAASERAIAQWKEAENRAQAFQASKARREARMARKLAKKARKEARMVRKVARMTRREARMARGKRRAQQPLESQKADASDAINVDLPQGFRAND